MNTASVYLVHSKTITERYPNSQLISQQELSIPICCILDINIVNACFDHRGYKMLVRPIGLFLWYCVKDNVVSEAVCLSSNCTRNLNPRCTVSESLFNQL